MKTSPKKKQNKKKPSEYAVQTVCGREFIGMSKPLLQLFKVLTAESPDFAKAEELVQQGANVNAVLQELNVEAVGKKWCTALEAILFQHYLRFTEDPPEDGDAAGETILQIIRFFLDHGFDPALKTKGCHQGLYALNGLLSPSIEYYPKQMREALFLLLDSKSFEESDYSEIADTILFSQSCAITTHTYPKFASLLEPITVMITSDRKHCFLDFYFTVVGRQIQRILVPAPAEGPALRRIEIEEPPAVLENAFSQHLCLELSDWNLCISALGQLSAWKFIPFEDCTDITDRFPGVAGCTITDITFTKAADSEDGLCDALVHLDSGAVLRFISASCNDNNDIKADTDSSEDDDSVVWGNIQFLPPQVTNNP